MEGWIKLHRSLLDWEWYDDSNTFRVFMHILLKASHKDRMYRGKKIEVGQVITGRQVLAIEVGLSVQQIRTSLIKLESTNEITIETTTQGTVIQVVKYRDYQQVTSKPTNEQPTSNQQVTTNKKEKKGKKERIHRAFNHLSISLNEYNKLLEDYTPQQVNGTLDAIENFKQNKKYKSLYLTAKNWLKKEPTKPKKIVPIPHWNETERGFTK